MSIFDREPGITKWESRDGALWHQHLPGGREIVVYPMLFGQALLCTGRIDRDHWERGYTYRTRLEAIRAAGGWIHTEKPPPGNWIKEQATQEA